MHAVISWGIQVRGIDLGPNGGLWSFMFPMVYLEQHWAGADLSGFIIGDRGESSPAGGNILGQYYVETAESLARYRTPHESLDLPADPGFHAGCGTVRGFPPSPHNTGRGCCLLRESFPPGPR